MTIAVAALFPWGRLKDARLPLEQAVILASDSRFTLSGGRVDDNGRKIYPLGRDTVAVYAGDVLAAQRGLSDIQELLRRRPKRMRTDAARSAGLLLRDAYRRERASAQRHERMKVGPLHVLVGVCHPDGQAEIVRFSSPKFAPLYVLGVDAVGGAEDVANFRWWLEEMQRQRWDESQDGMKLDPKPEDWRRDVVLGVRGSLESSDRSQTIGGPIQSVIVTRSGWSEPGISWVREGEDPTIVESWEDLTVSVQNVLPYRLARKGPRPVAEADLVYSHISD